MKYELIEIKKIDSYEVTNEIVYDIEVEHDHSFCVDDGIIVHNSMCTTRLVTGHGLSTLSSIIDIEEYRSSRTADRGVPLIADGGFKRSGDIVKALAFGADVVCLGGMLSATSATPGPIIDTPNGKFKEMYGMSSRTAQERHKGGLRRGIAEEGIDMLVPYKGDTSEYVEKLIGGVQSGLSYSGAKNIQELRENFEYVILSSGSMKESKL